MDVEAIRNLRVDLFIRPLTTDLIVDGIAKLRRSAVKIRRKRTLSQARSRRKSQPTPERIALAASPSRPLRSSNYP